MPLYPLNLQISGRTCLVLGGGEVAERKIAALLACGAAVTVVSPQISSQLQELQRDGQIQVRPRKFQESDVDGAILVIAATDDPEVNQQAAEACRKRNILVNVVDKPPLCDFYVPASLSRGDLLITISTNGRSPLLAKRLRTALEKQFGPEYGPFLEMVGRLRTELQTKINEPQRRAAIEAEFLSSPALSWLTQGRYSEAQELLNQYISKLA